MSDTTIAVAQQKTSDQTTVDTAVVELCESAPRLTRCSLENRIQLANDCIRGVELVATEWVESACLAKGIPHNSPARSEEITAGPVSVVRYLRLFIDSLQAIQRDGQPHLPGPPREEQGQTIVPIFPTKSLYDRLLFNPMKAETWLEPSVSPDQIFGDNISIVSGESSAQGQVCVVLGAGNVSAIPATDALTKILQDNCVVLLKMNPVNAYLGTIFERSLAPLIKAGFLRIIYGGAETGRYAVGHDRVDEVHITGSIDTHDAIVWGPRERQAHRKATHQRVLEKRVTSELGNVSPWIIAPGNYSDAQLRFQAENITASITNNASFNCIATKLLITWERCPHRAELLQLIENTLQTIPPRVAYYPGAMERFTRFAEQTPTDHHLPWTLRKNISIEQAPHLFNEESFVCVCGEVRIDAESPEQFVQKATEFANDRTWGTLAAAITVAPNLTNSATIHEAIRKLHYGTVGVNQWPAVSYALMSPPWGGYPGSTLADAESGIGWVHNTYLLDRPQKTVLTCPLTMSPKPMWFSTHRRPEAVAWKLFDLYCQPRLSRLPGLLLQSLRG
ncbi:MAG: aldehyde dehydrogenase family protein [Planctomycetaceae bacterium]|nr:aldehyde dehydrogenase family protein [Planctomycetaceae bacterium]